MDNKQRAHELALMAVEFQKEDQAKFGRPPIDLYETYEKNYISFLGRLNTRFPEDQSGR